MPGATGIYLKVALLSFIRNVHSLFLISPPLVLVLNDVWFFYIERRRQNRKATFEKDLEGFILESGAVAASASIGAEPVSYTLPLTFGKDVSEGVQI